MTPLNAHISLAARQHHVISIAQLRSLGYSKEAIRHLVRTQRLFRQHPGVFAVGREQLTDRGRWKAAELAGPPDGGLGRISASVFWELLRHDTRSPQLIVPTSRSSRGPRDVSIVRSRTLLPDDFVTEDAIRVTTVLRTLVDLSRSPLQDRFLDAAVRQAGRSHRVDLQQLRGMPRLDRIVRLYDPLIALTESDFEALFLAMCTKHRLPMPQPQVRFGRRRADFTWTEFRLVVECQSRRWHGNDVSYQDDRARQRALQSAGFIVLPFAWAEVMHTPAAVAREIRSVMRQRAHLVGW